MTEEEARGKLCPLQVASALPILVQAFKDGATRDGAKHALDMAQCCASDCMWWGWDLDALIERRGRCEAPGSES